MSMSRASCNKKYTVTMRTDEDEGKVIDVQCLDCAASLGCKHAVALLMWVQCYWKKPRLAGAGTTLKCITIKDFGNLPEPTVDNSFLRDGVELGTKKKSKSQLMNHFRDINETSSLVLTVS
ncbi:hypothetical protein J437_LFUL013053 [Ladona fulva]|uniref:SWIM-type domain-containing protein n=1 Tax=Ladona fulva TaxID=123851 RepID=A0A8K0KL84_LADFU|nr:hypothetical protein J437_LFUL013053 [Ladona fulva]